MKRKILFQLFALGLFLSVTACQIPENDITQEAEQTAETGGQWLAFAELQCGNNPWGYCNTTPDTKVCVKKYVQDQGFTVLEVTLTPAPADLVTCAACHCPTGRTFKVRVQEADVTKLEKVGFKKQ
ncbi:hypothetical protein [Rufibacter latericius]|nr:hypothetical protein [Rufibacter latericius]